MRGVHFAPWLLGVCLALPAASEQPDWLAFEPAPDPFPAGISLGEIAVDEARREELIRSDAPYVELLWWCEIDLTRDGRVRQRVVHVRHYLSDRDTEWGGEMEFIVKPSHEAAIIRAAYTISADGTRVQAAADSVQTLPELQPRVFSDVRRVIIPVPAVAAGATAVLAYEMTFRADEWPLPWSTLFTLQSVSPVETFLVSVLWPQDDDRLSWKTNDPDLACTETPGRLRCEKQRGVALQLDPDLAALRDVMPELLIERTGTWAALAQSVGAIVNERLEQSIPRSVVEPLIAGAEDDSGKWDALYRFVSQDVRYLGLEHSSASVVPNPPLRTLERRYGDCKDKVTLLVALARAAGLDAHPVLVATGRRDLQRLMLPAPSYFDHMVACRRDERGETHCADPTVIAASPAESLLHLSGNAALDIEPATVGPRALPLAMFAWDISVESATELKCDGEVLGSRTRRLRGIAAQAYRAGLSSLTPADRRRTLEEEFQQAAGGAPTDVSLEGLDDSSEPLVTRARYSVPGAGRLADQRSFSEGSLWLRFHGLSLRSENRAHPFRNPGLRVRSTHRYDVCPETRVRFGGAVLDMEAPFGTLRRDYAVDSEGATATSELLVPGGDVLPADIPGFNRFLEAALDQTDVWFSLEPKR